MRRGEQALLAVMALVLIAGCVVAGWAHSFKNVPPIALKGVFAADPHVPDLGESWRVELPLKARMLSTYGPREDEALGETWRTAHRFLEVSLHQYDGAWKAHRAFWVLQYPRAHFADEGGDVRAHTEIAPRGETTLDGNECVGERCARWVLVVRYGQYALRVYAESTYGEDGRPSVLTAKAEMEAMAQPFVTKLAEPTGPR